MVYLKAAWLRLASGQSLPVDAPALPPPPVATGITVQATTASTTLVLRVTHTLTVLTGTFAH